MRFVLLHNHIFKNAGSTVDHVFERAGFRNTRLEATAEAPVVHPAAVLAAVKRDPRVEYISSHVFSAPRPADTEDVGFIDITFIRHPIERLHSIYRYSRGEGVNDFPTIDKRATFAQFVDALPAAAPAHLHSPQTVCLGNARNFYFPPGPDHLERAMKVVADTRFLGVVDLFEKSFEAFTHYCKLLLRGKNLAALAPPFPTVNRSEAQGGSAEERLSKIRSELGDDRFAYVQKANALDLELYRFARSEVLRRHSLIAPG